MSAAAIPTEARLAATDVSDALSIAASNKALIVQHFDDFVNKRDLSAINRNMTPDFVDRDGPGGKPAGRDGDRAMMEAMHKMLPDLRVAIKMPSPKGRT